MTREEHQTRRRVIVGIEGRLLAKEIGVPTLEDFIFLDYTRQPARIRRHGASLWLFYFHPDKTWVTRAPIDQAMAAILWDDCRVLSTREIKHLNLLGGVKLLGTAEGLSAGSAVGAGDCTPPCETRAVGNAAQQVPSHDLPAPVIENGVWKPRTESNEPTNDYGTRGERDSAH